MSSSDDDGGRQRRTTTTTRDGYDNDGRGRRRRRSTTTTRTTTTVGEDDDEAHGNDDFPRPRRQHRKAVAGLLRRGAPLSVANAGPARGRSALAADRCATAAIARGRSPLAGLTRPSPLVAPVVGARVVTLVILGPGSWWRETRCWQAAAAAALRLRLRLLRQAAAHGGAPRRKSQPPRRLSRYGNI